jgi:CubicO group peptidase (beta-lactamase class C family)
VEHGRIDLDRPVNAYLGVAKVHSTVWDANEATVRRIASHTAGLTTYDRECAPHDLGCSMDDTIRHYAVMVRPPGRDFDYSNLDYGIVGEVVARVSGRSFPMFLRDAIFRPLGMSTCTLSAASSSTPGACAALCSAHDLALFAQSMSKARIDAPLSGAVSSGPGQHQHRRTTCKLDSSEMANDFSGSPRRSRFQESQARRSPFGWSCAS